MIPAKDVQLLAEYGILLPLDPPIHARAGLDMAERAHHLAKHLRHPRPLPHLSTWGSLWRTHKRSRDLRAGARSLYTFAYMQVGPRAQTDSQRAVDRMNAEADQLDALCSRRSDLFHQYCSVQLAVARLYDAGPLHRLHSVSEDLHVLRAWEALALKGTSEATRRRNWEHTLQRGGASPDGLKQSKEALSFMEEVLKNLQESSKQYAAVSYLGTEASLESLCTVLYTEAKEDSRHLLVLPEAVAECMYEVNEGYFDRSELPDHLGARETAAGLWHPEGALSHSGALTTAVRGVLA